jgi:predicted permease
MELHYPSSITCFYYTGSLKIETKRIEFLNSILASLPIISLIIMGVFLKRIQFLSDTTVVEIKKFVSHIALPALLFNAFLHLEIEINQILMIGVMTSLCFLMMFVGRVVKRVAKIDTPYFPLLIGGYEMGMFGYAIFLSFYGQENFPKIAFLSLGQIFYIFTYLISTLSALQNGKGSMKEGLKRFVTSPIIIAIVMGLVLGAFKSVVSPTPFLRSLHSLIIIISSLAVPLISITIGYGLKISTKGLKLSLITIIVRKSFSIPLALLINHFIIDNLLHMDSIYKIALLFIVIAPPPFIISVYVNQKDEENLAYIDRTVSLDCLVSIVLSVVIMLLV